MTDLLTDISLLVLWLLILGAPYILGGVAVTFVAALFWRIFGNRT